LASASHSAEVSAHRFSESESKTLLHFFVKFGLSPKFGLSKRLIHKVNSPIVSSVMLFCYVPIWVEMTSFHWLFLAVKVRGSFVRSFLRGGFRPLAVF